MKEKAPRRSKQRRASARNAKGRERAVSATIIPRGGVAVVCAVAIVASIAGILNAFTQDDLSILVGSTRLHGFGALRDILTLPYWPPPAAPDLYRPVASIVLAAQYALGGGAPFVFRITSYALYALASVGVYRLALRLMPASIALLVAALFAAHPVHVEAVALAVTQNELIVGAVAAFMTVLYIDRRRSESGALSARDWALLGVGYAIAGFSKEPGLMIPAFLILAEIFLTPSRALADRVRQLWRGFALLVAIATVMIAVRTLVLSGVVGPTMIAEALRGQTMGGRLLTMLQIVPQWSRLLYWPAHLRAEYSPREFVASTSFGGEEATGLAIVILVLMSIWLARKRAPALSFGLAWCCIALFPVSNVVIPTGILLAERTLFLPSVGFVLALGGGMAFVASRRPAVTRHARTLIALAASVLVVAALGRSAQRQRVWQDPVTLTVASVQDAPRSWRVQQVYGDMLFSQGRAAEAIAAFRRAIELAPESWRPRNYLAERLRMIGDDSDAVMLLRASLAEDPRQIATIAALAPALLGAGRYAEAKELADSIVVAEKSPPMMVQMSRLADSAMKVNAPPGSIRIGIPTY
jgi:4-amino-4-deoxy-L-arabinose transferase-like glycosyltransferase